MAASYYEKKPAFLGKDKISGRELVGALRCISVGEVRMRPSC